VKSDANHFSLFFICLKSKVKSQKSKVKSLINSFDNLLIQLFIIHYLLFIFFWRAGIPHPLASLLPSVYAYKSAPIKLGLQSRCTSSQGRCASPCIPSFSRFAGFLGSHLTLQNLRFCKDIAQD
jgi:hypothetical protein